MLGVCFVWNCGYVFAKCPGQFVIMGKIYTIHLKGPKLDSRLAPDPGGISP